MCVWSPNLASNFLKSKFYSLIKWYQFLWIISCANAQFTGECFFQSTFEANEMFCLLNKFVIFTNQKPALKITTSQQSLTVVKTYVTKKRIKKKSEIHVINQNRYKLKKVDIENHYLWFSMLQLKRSWDKRKLFFFYNQIYFPFSFSCTCLMGMLEKTEYNLICNIFSEIFLITRIPHSTVLIHFCEREKIILSPPW